MKPSKRYIINEEELLELLESKKQLEYLESTGVDNWSYYGECREEFIKEELECITKKPIEQQEIIDNDIDMIDIAKELIKFYEEYKDYTDDLK